MILILVEAEYEVYKKNYAKDQKHFEAAAEKGLVELLISANENGSKALDELSVQPKKK